MGFHLTPKSTSSWALGDENAIGSFYVNFGCSDINNVRKQTKKKNLNQTKLQYYIFE